jgi:hypothetical protein
MCVAVVASVLVLSYANLRVGWHLLGPQPVGLAGKLVISIRHRSVNSDTAPILSSFCYRNMRIYCLPHV